MTSPTERACAVADEILFPNAQITDTSPLVPRSNLEALRDAGLNGLQGPAELPGGSGADHAASLPVFEAVAGGCGATAFVWAQHHGAVRRLVGGDGPARDRWLPLLCDGSVTAGIGFAYLRRPGPAAVRATPAGRGWRLDGEAPWISGWGLVDIIVVMARADDGRVVTVVVDDPAQRPELVAGPPQRLAVMNATGTVSLRFDGLLLSAAALVGVQSAEVWKRRDRAGSALPPAAPLGISARALTLLEQGGSRSASVVEAASSFDSELEERRAAAVTIGRRIQTLMNADDPDGFELALVEGARERDRGLALARRVTDASIAAKGGGAMALDHPAQRLSREATFYLIQAQTGDLRTATLGRTLVPPPR